MQTSYPHSNTGLIQYLDPKLYMFLLYLIQDGVTSVETSRLFGWVDLSTFVAPDWTVPGPGTDSPVMVIWTVVAVQHLARAAAVVSGGVVVHAIWGWACVFSKWRSLLGEQIQLLGFTCKITCYHLLCWLCYWMITEYRGSQNIGLVQYLNGE